MTTINKTVAALRALAEVSAKMDNAVVDLLPAVIVDALIPEEYDHVEWTSLTATAKWLHDKINRAHYRVLRETGAMVPVRKLYVDLITLAALQGIKLEEQDKGIDAGPKPDGITKDMLLEALKQTRDLYKQATHICARELEREFSEVKSKILDLMVRENNARWE